MSRGLISCRRAVRALVLLACGLALVNRVAADEPARKFEVHDLSLWVVDSGGGNANQHDRFPSALPVTVATSRTDESSREERKMAPLGLITFHGDPVAELDVDLRTRSGSFLAHWPPCDSVPNHLRWVGKPPFSLAKDIATPSDLSFVDPDHWFNQARASDALYVKHGARVERFLAYDVELTKAGVPIKLEGGPDSYLVVNNSESPLHDVLVVKRTPEGPRVAWLDVLPAKGTLASKSAAEKKPAPDSKDSKSTPVEALFDDAKSADAKDETAKSEAAKSEAAFAPEAAKAEQTGDAPADPPQDAVAPAAAAPAEPAASTPAKKPPAMNLFGGLPKKVEAKLLAEQQGAEKEAAQPSQGIEVTLSEPLSVGSADAEQQTTAALAERLSAQGLTEAEVALFVERYGPLFFEGESVMIACRLPAADVEEALPLSVFPVPKKTVRVAMMLIRNADPQMGDEVERLIVELGNPSFAAREKAQQRLHELGPVAFSALQVALGNSDAEIVIRAERILLRQNQTPTPQGGKPAGGGNIQLPAVRINR